MGTEELFYRDRKPEVLHGRCPDGSSYKEYFFPSYQSRGPAIFTSFAMLEPLSSLLFIQFEIEPHEDPPIWAVPRE